MLKKAACFVFFYLPFMVLAQEYWILDSSSDIYYAGINPLALLTSIRGNVTSSYLPYLAGEEAGLSVFVGKFWNSHYNVETRLSLGSPASTWFQAKVQSGFNYCFNK